jgi:predicted AAA+ superfamily ATPase
MRPMSLYESKESSGEVSLSELFNDPGYHVRGKSELNISDQVDLVCRGGWPGILKTPKDKTSEYIKDYYDGLVRADINETDDIKRNPSRAKAVLKSYARGISTLTDYQTMVRDLENVGEGMDIKTLVSYTSAYEKIFIIENVEAWTPKLRSASIIRTKAKKQFSDPSVAVAALGISAKELTIDMETFGFFFESMVTRDLRAYIETINGEVFHYRDNTGLEVDCILKLHDGRWAAVEVKVGGNKIEEAAANLLKLKDRVDERHMNKPSFLMVIYGGQHAYRRPDGVYVVPVGCLKD